LFSKPDLHTAEGRVEDIVGGAAGSAIGVPIAAAPIVAGIGLAGGAADLAFHPPGDTTTTSGQPSLFSDPAATPQPTPLPAVQAATPPQPTDPTTPASLFGSSPVGPTFTQQGETGTSIGEAAVGLGLALLGVMAGRFTHSYGAAIDTTARDARFADPAYAQAVQDYHNDVISRGPNSGTLLPPGGTQTPAPTPRGSAVRQATTYVVDKTLNGAAQVQDVLNLGSADPSIAERLTSQYGNVLDSRLQQDRTSNFMETGHDPVSGLTIPSVKDLLNDRASLPTDKAAILAEGLKANDELDTRARNTTLWGQNNPGIAPSLEDVAHNFIGHGEDELRAKVTAMMADPQLADIASRYKGVTDGMVDIGVHPNWGFFEPSEAARLQGERPNYVPEMDINGRAVHPFGPRAASAFTGQAQIMTDPIRDLAQHVEALYPQFARNQLNQMVMDHMLDVQARVPGAAQAMVDVAAPTGVHASYYPTSGLPELGGQARDPIVAVRTGSGVKYVRNDEPITYGAMTNHSLASARVQLGIGNTARRIFTQFTTGIGSTLTGRSIPLHTAAATALVAPVNAPRNMRAGLLDYGLQKASPSGTVNPALQSVARGLDIPLNLPGTAVSYAMGVGDRRIKNFADVFAQGNDNWANRWLRAVATDHVVDTMQQAAENRWNASTTKWIKEDVGTSGAGSPIRLDAPGFMQQTSAGDVGIRSLGANLAPRAYFKGDWMGAKPFVISLRNAVGEALGNLSDAGLDYTARLNKDNPNISPEALTYNIRKLYGNPSTMGSSPIAQGIGKNLPWANIGAQELASTGGALARDPLGTGTTLAVGLGTLAAITILTHMRSQQHMQFLENQVSTQQREANMILALNSDPSKPTIIPLPRSLRMGYAFMLDVMSKAINTVGAMHDPTTFNGVWEGLKDFLGSHITTSDAMAMQHAGVDMVDALNLPPYAGHIDWNDAINNGLINAIHGSWSGPVDKALPGQAPATPLDTKTGETTRNILTNVLGAAAATVYNTPAAIGRYQQQGHSFLDSVGMAGHDWLQGSREGNMSMNNMLFETSMRLSKQPPIAEALEPTLVALKMLPSVQNPSQEGFTARGRAQLPVPTTGLQPVSPDALVTHMLLVTHGYASKIDAAMAPINAIKTQMGTVDKMGMDPEQRREWLNQATRNMADRYKLVQAYTDDMYHALSQFAGKPIHSLYSIDWKRDRTQFSN
jgi:hypothetical protein